MLNVFKAVLVSAVCLASLVHPSPLAAEPEGVFAASVLEVQAQLAVLAGRTLVGPGPRDEELVRREEIVVLGVGDRGVEELADLVGRTALTEPQDLAGVGDVQAADETEDLTDLGRGRAAVTESRARLGHGYRRP